MNLSTKLNPKSRTVIQSTQLSNHHHPPPHQKTKNKKKTRPKTRTKTKTNPDLSHATKPFEKALRGRRILLYTVLQFPRGRPTLSHLHGLLVIGRIHLVIECPGRILCYLRLVIGGLLLAVLDGHALHIPSREGGPRVAWLAVEEAHFEKFFFFFKKKKKISG